MFDNIRLSQTLKLEGLKNLLLLRDNIPSFADKTPEGNHWSIILDGQ